MKAANKRLLVSVAALVLAVSLTVTATFAWFSASTTVTANGIRLTVTAGEGIWISLDDSSAASYRSTVNLAADSDELKALLEAIELKPLTPNVADVAAVDATEPVYALDGKLMNDDGSLAGTGSPEEAGYAQFDLYFRSGIAYDVILESSTSISATTTVSTPDAWRNFTAGELSTSIAGKIDLNNPIVRDSSGPLVNASLANAARVGFSSSTANDFIIYRKNVGKGFSATDFKFNAAHDHYNTLTGSYPANRYEGKRSMTVDTLKYDEYAGTDPVPFTYNVYTHDTASDATAIAHEAPTLITSPADSPALVTLAPQAEDNDWHDAADGFNYGKITVKIWMEGTDADCFEILAKNIMNISLVFSGKGL